MSDRSVLASKLGTICEVLGVSPSEALELLAEADNLSTARQTRSYTVAEFLPLVEAATKPPVKVPSSVVLQLAQGVTVRGLGGPVAWGKQASCDVIGSDPGSLARAVGYVVKGVSEDLAPTVVDFASLRGQHVARLHEAAVAMTCGEACPGVRGGCRSRKHRNFGATTVDGRTSRGVHEATKLNTTRPCSGIVS